MAKKRDENRSVFFKNQALLTINLTPTPEYTEMACIKILKATGEFDYVLVRDVNEPGCIAEALSGGKIDDMFVQIFNN